MTISAKTIAGIEVLKEAAEEARAKAETAWAAWANAETEARAAWAKAETAEAKAEAAEAVRYAAARGL